MSFWDEVIGAAAGSTISGGFGLLSNYQNKQYSKDLMDYQQKLNWNTAKQSALELPALQMQGYKNADLNPLLAVGGMSANTAQGVSLGQAQTENIGQAMVEGASAGINAAKNIAANRLMEQQVKVAKQQEDTLQSQEKLNNANALKTLTDSVNSSKRLNADLRYVKAQIDNINADVKLKNKRLEINPLIRYLGRGARVLGDIINAGGHPM